MIFVFISAIYIYFTKAAYWKIDRESRDWAISEIKSAPTLPNRFYDIYNQIYSGALENGQLHYLLNRDNTDSECPCRLAAYELLSIYDIQLITATFWLENQVTQKECLNYYMSDFKFGNNISGIFEASIFYYQKDIVELDNREIIELLIMMRNPALYNKNRNNERLEKGVTEIINRIKL